MSDHLFLFSRQQIYNMNIDDADDEVKSVTGGSES